MRIKQTAGPSASLRTDIDRLDDSIRKMDERFVEEIARDFSDITASFLSSESFQLTSRLLQPGISRGEYFSESSPSTVMQKYIDINS